MSWVKKHFKYNWSSAECILLSYTRIPMFWSKDKQPPDKQNRNRYKSALKRGLLLEIVAGSTTAMGSSDLITSSTKHMVEIIRKTHHKRGYLYIENLNNNDRYIIKQVSECLPSGVFLLGTETISLITDI